MESGRSQNHGLVVAQGCPAAQIASHRYAGAVIDPHSVELGGAALARGQHSIHRLNTVRPLGVKADWCAQEFHLRISKALGGAINDHASA